MPDATGRPPAVVIIVRHGARLDAADKKWHLTSPTPYDPPLTFGGWTQSRALGARIASVLHTREKSIQAAEHTTNGTGSSQDGTESESSKPGGTRRRRHKIIIHTSPFLRCVQTSIAVSAGMSQFYGSPQSQHMPAKSPYLHSQRNHGGPPISPLLSPIPEPRAESSTQSSRLQKYYKPKKFRKPIIRVDAVLGEWLSPDYYEMITPPPSSVMMVASARADLLRPGDYNDLVTEARTTRGIHGFPGGWGSVSTNSESIPEDGPLASMSTLGQSLSRRDRSSSVDSAKSGQGSPRLSPSQQTAQGGYQPPTLTYAVSGSDPIPAGFVAHARDACVEVDYPWDSMREPLNWGDGGEYGEEWSSMHRRFRKGLDHMLSWYRDRDAAKSDTKTTLKNESDESVTSQTEDDDDDDNTDTVLILVTHGAGCNALIGALTNQPVLLDVGMASLTMAVRKDILSAPNSGRDSAAPPPSMARFHTFSQDYDVKLIASTEHLRAHSNNLAIPQLQSGSPVMPPSSPLARHRYSQGAASPVDGPFSIGDSAPRSSSAIGIGGVRRTMTTVSSRNHQRAFSPSAGPGGLSSSPGGLWSRPTPSSSEATEDDDDLLPNFGNSGDMGRAEKENMNRRVEDEKKALAETGADKVKPRPGLWGPGPPQMVGEKDKDREKKRRWTVNEH